MKACCHQLSLGLHLLGGFGLLPLQMGSGSRSWAAGVKSLSIPHFPRPSPVPSSSFALGFGLLKPSGCGVVLLKQHGAGERKLEAAEGFFSVAFSSSLT